MAEEERLPHTDSISESVTDSPLPLGEGQGKGEESGVPSTELRASAVPLPREIEDPQAAAEARSEALAAELALRQAQDDTLQQTQDALRQAQEERDGLREQLSLAAAKYREAMLSSLPEVPPELVSGQSVEEIDHSLVFARATVDAVRRQLAGRAAAERVPAGAPARGAPDLSALSPREKIALALSRSA